MYCVYCAQPINKLYTSTLTCKKEMRNPLLDRGSVIFTNSREVVRPLATRPPGLKRSLDRYGAAVKLEKRAFRDVDCQHKAWTRSFNEVTS